MNISQRIREGGYDQPDVPKAYNEFSESDLERQKGLERLANLLPDEVKLTSSNEEVKLEDCTLLELGAGAGAFTKIARKRGVGKVIAMDKAYAMVNFLDKRFSDDNQVEVIEGDMVKPGLPDNSVELVAGAGIVREIPPPTKDNDSERDFLQSIMQVLKSGGVCVLDSIYSARNNLLAENFDAERKKEIEYHQDSDKPVIQRKFVFSTHSIADRLKELGFNCQVETFFTDQEFAQVKITLLDKNESENESR